jgi:hypothetical protein
MAGLLDQLGLGGLDERFRKFSTDPLGMASLGLLLQPRKRPIGTSGFDYALQGMQAATQNREAQAYAQRLEEETKARQQEQERQARVMQMLSAGAAPEERALMASMSPEEAMNYQDYKLKIQADQDKRIEAARIEEERKRQTGALSQFRIGLSGPERLAFDALPLEEQAKIAAQSAFPNAALGGNLPAGIQEFLYNQENPGYMAFRREMASLSPEAQAAAAFSRAYRSQEGQIQGEYKNRALAAEAERARLEGAETGKAQGQVLMAPQVAQSEASRQEQITAAQERAKASAESASKQGSVAAFNFLADEMIGTPSNPGIMYKVASGGPMNLYGKASNVFDTQDVNEFENIREQMSTQLRALFRIPGEGTLSDKEQAQYGLTLPSISFDKKINENAIRRLRQIIKLRTSGAAAPIGGAATPSPMGAQGASMMTTPSGAQVTTDMTNGGWTTLPNGVRVRRKQ